MSWPIGFWPLCSIKMYVMSALFAFMLVKNKLIFSCDVLTVKRNSQMLLAISGFVLGKIQIRTFESRNGIFFFLRCGTRACGREGLRVFFP